MNAAMRAGWLRHLMIAVTQQHHRELIAPFQSSIPADAVVLDVGAHAGQFSKLFARMAPRGTVHAFEPSAYARSVLLPALRLNRMRNVRVHPAGLSDSPGQMVLHTPIKRRGGMGFGVAHLGPGGAGDVSQTVELMTLDDFAARQGLARVDFIKADVEGWEAHMLRGGVGTLARFHPALYLEVDGDLLARAGESPGEIWRILTPLGYRARIAPGFTPVEAYAGKGDYLFTVR